MDTQPFNPQDWLPKNQEAPKNQWPGQPVNDPLDIEKDVERIVVKIENRQTDITAGYENWLQIGFALADGLGENGRSYFHRISRFYPRYTHQETDKKYDSCLKNKHPKTTISTFFYLAKLAGIEIAPEKKIPVVVKDPKKNELSDDLLATEADLFNTPLLPQKVYHHLPKLLTETCSLFNNGIEKDVYLLSAITVLSGCLPQIEGFYFNRLLSAHLYLFIVGPSASGKGIMVWSRYLAQAIHEEMVRDSAALHAAYVKEVENYEKLPKIQKAGLFKPEDPPRKMLFIPANSSSAALTQLLAENNFSGIIFESEADTLSNTAKQDWGDSSDIFRKAFHHENTSMARRMNREMIEITNPHLAMCLSGTPRQVSNLMPEVENGLFSRFMYYAFQDSRDFLNPFVSYQPINYHDFFVQKGYEVYHLYDQLKKLPYPILFKLTEKQGQRFTAFFQTLLDKNKLLLSRDLDANTKRLGVITFRIAMVLSALRLMQLEIGCQMNETLTCWDTDFDTAMTIAATLESHAVAVYRQMPKVSMKGIRLAFYEKLPKQFDRQQYLAVAHHLGIGDKAAEKYIGIFNSKLLAHQHNSYTKLY